MVEPRVRATEIESMFPWLLHWMILDERLGGFRSDAYALQTPAGLMIIDALPLEASLQARLEPVGGLFLTHGNHQRSAWRLRRELGAPVYAPAGAQGLDEEPDHWFDEGITLPGGLQAWRAEGFDAACYLSYRHGDGTGVVFCGDLVCQDPDGPYRFPDQPGYFEPTGGAADAHRLLDLHPDTLCPAHARPTSDGARTALEAALA